MAAVSVAAVWLTVGATGPSTARPAGAVGRPAAATGHRAAVIIDTGTEVKSVCVRFQEESITGVELLARAGVDPVFQGFPGKGAAVCALCGVGCPAGESCLTCNAEGRFWSYSRAPAGTASLRTSGVGGSSTTVRDGDVEGWRFGLGGTPPFATVEQVCGEVPAATSSTMVPVVTTAAGPTAPMPSAPPMAGGTTTTQAATGATTTRPVAFPSTSAPAAGGSNAVDGGQAPATEPGSGTDNTPTTPASGLAAERAASEREGDDRGWPGLVLFAAVVAGLVAWATIARRRRRPPA